MSDDLAVWPDEALEEQVASIGPVLLRLIDDEPRWVHRRVERLELSSARQLLRTVSADLSVPLIWHCALALHRREKDRGTAEPKRYVVPLGVLPKEPLQDFMLKPDSVHRLTAEQANPLVVAALAPDAERCGAPLEEVLLLLRRIVRRETAGSRALEELRALLGAAAEGPAAEARARLLDRAQTLDARYVLLVVVSVDAGAPTRVTYSHRQPIGPTGKDDVDDPPLVIDVGLPHASGPGCAYRVEVVAPDGLEVETAAFVARQEQAREVLAVANADAGEGAFVQLRAPDANRRPDSAGLEVRFGFPSGGIHHLATVAGAASTVALALAFVMSLVLEEKMKGGSASTFLAAPALVTGLVLGFATTRVTSRPVNRLRLAAFTVALLGVLGGLTVALFGESKTYLNERHVTLGVLAATSVLVTGGWPVRAWLRKRERIELTGVAHSES